MALTKPYFFEKLVKFQKKKIEKMLKQKPISFTTLFMLGFDFNFPDQNIQNLKKKTRGH